MCPVTLNTIVETMVFICGIILLIKLLNVGLKSKLHNNRGWSFIIAGYSLIVFAIFIDIIEDYLLSTPDLIIVKVILEEVVGFLLGFILISIGIWNWIPKIITLNRARKALNRSQNQLKSRLKDYSLQLEEEREKNKIVSAQKENLLNNMSHELRTPLNGIIGCVEIIMETDTSPEQQKYLERANQSSDDLLNIINNILDLKDLEKEDFNIYREHFSIEPFIYELMGKYEKIAKNKNLIFRWSLDHRVPKKLFGSPAQIKTAISKIIENSITYTKVGRIDIDIYSEPLSDSKVDLFFRISDTGVGIPSEHHDSIFSEFTKVPYIDLTPSPGLGLGLSVASTLLKKMKGQIVLESSEEYKGSIFKAHLPMDVIKQDEKC